MEANLYVYYTNYDVEKNIQIALVWNADGYLKEFHSLTNRARQYAKRWAKENNIVLKEL